MKIEGLSVIDVDESEEITVAVRADDLLEGDIADYKLAWKEIPSDERRARPDIPLRIHASIRRQLKAGANNPNAIAFAQRNSCPRYAVVRLSHRL